MGKASGCGCCGMQVAVRAYHPYMACLAFHTTRSGSRVDANLAEVVRYGMEAERAGITIEAAMSDITATRRAVLAAANPEVTP